jgi:uncharacterized protein YecT (DUF1311 family)
LHYSFCFAIDNPDTPDYVAEFAARAEKYEGNIQRKAVSTSEIVRYYFEYEKFLDQELNQAYANLMKHLTGDSKRKLVQSQKRWLQFRDAEFNFIAGNWTMEKFGSSYVLSRGACRTTIIRGRIVELLHYLKNYPAN